MLRPGPLSVFQIASVLGAPASTASGHLLELRHAGLVSEQRRGKWVYSQLVGAEPVTAVLDPVLASIEDDPQIRRDAAVAAGLCGTSPAALCASANATEWEAT